MIYDIHCLNEDEMKVFMANLEHYKNHDKLDLLVELSTNDPYDLIMRTKNKKKEKKIELEENINQISEDLKFCDGDSCMVDYSRHDAGGCGCG